jgi:hypothetical protein
MRWVKVNKAHFNTSLILAFYWSIGKLYVYWLGDADYECYNDADRENYLRLCRALGVAPVEEDSDG